MLNRPQTGERIPADFFGRLYDLVMSNQIRGDGRTISVKRTPSGTTISMIKRGGGMSGERTAGMFTIMPDDSGGFKIVDPFVPAQAGIATINGQFYTVAKAVLPITASAYIYLRYTLPTESGSGNVAEVISSATIETSSDIYAYYLIGRVILQNGSLTIAQDHAPGNLIMWWQGPCWSRNS